MKKLNKLIQNLLFPFRNKCPICQANWSHQLHGFHQYLQARTPFKKTVWLFAIFYSLIFALNYSVFLLNDYVDRRVITLNTIHQVKRLYFPNITVCPKYVDALNFSAIEQDLHTRLPQLNKNETKHLILFTMTSAGFQHFDVFNNLITQTELLKLTNLFNNWRGNRSKLEFYQFIFETNGYKCEEMFHSCMYGKRLIPCCDLFRPTYVMLRGRCFRMRAFAQTEPDETGKLTLFFREMNSTFLGLNGRQRQIITYLSQQFEDIPTFPRFYLNINYWYRLRLKRKHISLLTPNEHCSPVEKYKKRGNCYVDSWLRERVIKPFNCSIFYFLNKNPSVEVCDPQVIFNNYFSIINVVDNLSVYQSFSKCLPLCKRNIIETQLFSNKFQDQRSNVGAKYKQFYFHLETSYENLQEEVYEEKLTISLPGFISQIGGQLNFFLGMSLISLLQFFILPIINLMGKGLLQIKRSLFSIEENVNN